MEYTNNNYLIHYGVRGMRWGVKRATRAAAKATTLEKHSEAMASLDKHRIKSTKKLSKLENQSSKLHRKEVSFVEKKDVKAAQINRKIAKYNKKIAKLETKATNIEYDSTKLKALISKNERMRKAFEEGIENIDQAKTEYGKRALSLSSGVA